MKGSLKNAIIQETQRHSQLKIPKNLFFWEGWEEWSLIDSVLFSSKELCSYYKVTKIIIK